MFIFLWGAFIVALSDWSHTARQPRRFWEKQRTYPCYPSNISRVKYVDISFVEDTFVAWLKQNIRGTELNTKPHHCHRISIGTQCFPVKTKRGPLSSPPPFDLSAAFMFVGKAALACGIVLTDGGV